MPKNVASRKISLQFQQRWNYNQHQSPNPQPQGAKSRPLSRDIRLPTQHRESEGGQITVPAQHGGEAYGCCSHSTLGWWKSHRAQGDTLPAGRWIHRDGTPERQPGRRASQNWEAPLEVGRKSLPRERYTGNKEGGTGTGWGMQLENGRRNSRVLAMFSASRKPSPGFPGGPVIKNLLAVQGTWVQALSPHVSGQLSPCATTTEAGVP